MTGANSPGPLFPVISRRVPGLMGSRFAPGAGDHNDRLLRMIQGRVVVGHHSTQMNGIAAASLARGHSMNGADRCQRRQSCGGAWSHKGRKAKSEAQQGHHGNASSPSSARNRDTSEANCPTGCPTSGNGCTRQACLPMYLFQPASLHRLSNRPWHRVARIDDYRFTLPSFRAIDSEINCSSLHVAERV
jgi:hypothetical protein